MQGIELFQLLIDNEELRVVFLVSFLCCLFTSLFIMCLIFKYSYDDKIRKLKMQRDKDFHFLSF